MAPNRKGFLYAAAFLGALLLLLLALPSTSRWFSAKEFEWKTRSKMNPSVLQAWASDLIRRFPPEHNFYLDLRGTNLPPGMAQIKGFSPMVSIVVGDEKVPRVVLFGSLGEPAILVGSSNFVNSSHETRLWKPGIYFRDARY